MPVEYHAKEYKKKIKSNPEYKKRIMKAIQKDLSILRKAGQLPDMYALEAWWLAGILPKSDWESLSYGRKKYRS